MFALLVMCVGLSRIQASITNDTICKSDSITIGNTYSNGFIYSWTPGGACTPQITVAPTTTIMYIETVLNTTFQIIYVDTFNVVVKPKPSVWITSPGGNNTVCIGGGLQLTANCDLNPVSYLWSTGAITQQITAYPTVNPTVYSVTCTYNGCSNTASFTVYIQAPPIAYTITGDSTYCSGQAGVTLGLNGSEADCYYKLYQNGVAIGTINGTGYPLNFGIHIAGTYIIKGFKNTLSCDAQMNGTLNVSVLPLPQAAGPIIGQTIVCQNSVMTYSTSIIQDASLYDWSLPTGATIKLGQGTPSIDVEFGPTSISGDIKVRGHNACGDGTFSAIFVTVHQTPDLTVTANNTSICAGLSITLTAITTVSGCTFWWSNNLGTANAVTAAPDTTTTYSVTATAPNGCSSIGYITIYVHPLPKVSLQLTQNKFCPDQGPTKLSGGLPAGVGGIYSGTCVHAGDTVVPSSTAPSTYIITYTYTDVYECSADATELAVFYAATPPIFLNINGPIYINTPPFDLKIYTQPYGGIFTGPGVDSINAIFYPAKAGSGVHQIFYNYTHPVTGCTTQNSTYISVGALGSNDLSVAVGNISIFPNPSANLLNLHGITKEIKSICIVNVFGEVALATDTITENMQINISLYVPGTYFICFTNADGLSTGKRFVKIE